MKQSIIRFIGIAAVVIVGILAVSSCNHDNPVTPTPVKPEPDPPKPDPPKDTTVAIISIIPTTVSYGDTIVVNGKNFSTTVTATINDVAASVISASATVIKVVVPVLTHTTNELKLKVGANTLSGGTITYEPDVFVAGSLNNDAVPLATYWKNGKAIKVSQNESALSAISVNTNGVYVAGWERINNLQLANYWKDGSKTTLGTGTSAVYAMAVDGTEVYTGGFEIIDGFDFPRYWHNTDGTTISVRDPIVDRDITGNGSCGGIYFDDNNVYAVGNYRNSQGRFAPWETKNGVVPAHTIPNNDKHAFANGVFVKDGAEYVVGTQNNPTTGLAMATIWKNGEPTSLTDGDNSVGIARAVIVVGSDVYVVGYEQEDYSHIGPAYAKYWKNGEPVKLSTVSSAAISIAVFDGDIYVSGVENNGDKDVAVYWKNGTRVSLTNGVYTSVGNAITLR